MLLSINVLSQIKVDNFETNVYLPKQKSTIYSLLNQISKQSGFLFIYDSKVIDNEKTVKIRSGKRRLKDAIFDAIGRKDVKIDRIGKHILISDDGQNRIKNAVDSVKSNHCFIEGRLVDSNSNLPLQFANISVLNSSLGTITNQEGIFKLIIPSDMSSSSVVCFSHLGYDKQELPFNSLRGKFVNISLVQRVMILPEVIVKAINPIVVLSRMRSCMQKNYYPNPSYLTSFYREGIEYNKNFRSLTEAVIKIYKSSYKRYSTDQVHLLKMRRINNYTAADTIIAKMSSGIDASLKLDLVKEYPDFLDVGNINLMYDYKYLETNTLDGKDVYVISFCQNKNVLEPHYAGKLYISSDDYSLLRVEMGILPSMAKESTDMFVSKQAQTVKLTVSSVNYVVNYKRLGGHYFINHVRGDLYFKAKKKRRLFGSSSIHTWFEMLPCKIDTVNVVKFNKSDRISPKTIFSETAFNYDSNFWGEYNYIILEQKIEDTIKKLSPKIEVIN